MEEKPNVVNFIYSWYLLYLKGDVWIFNNVEIRIVAGFLRSNQVEVH